MNVVDLAGKTAQAAKFLKAMANGHRLTILCELNNGEAQVSELQQALGLSQSSLSQHLAVLRNDGLVRTRRESQAIYYSLADANVTRVIALLEELFCAKNGPKKAKTAAPQRRNVATSACGLKRATTGGKLK
jgi:ArsR family transcriptional regulator, virulence genes transcriptional regulator